MPISYTAAAKRKRAERAAGKVLARKRRKLMTYTAPVSFTKSVLPGRRNALGQSKVVTLNWCNKAAVPSVSVAGAGSLAEFNISSAFKPDTLLTNNRQPNGYDQMTPFFDYYHVTAVKFKVSFWGVSNESRLVAAIVTDRQSAALTNVAVETLIEQGLSDWRTISQNTSGPCVTTIEGTVDLPKIHGKTYSQYVADDVTGAQVATSPVNPVYLYLLASHGDVGSVNLGITPFFLELQFTIKFHGSQITPAS